MLTVQLDIWRPNYFCNEMYYTIIFYSCPRLKFIMIIRGNKKFWRNQFSWENVEILILSRSFLEENMKKNSKTQTWFLWSYREGRGCSEKSTPKKWNWIWISSNISLNWEAKIKLVWIFYIKFDHILILDIYFKCNIF